MGSICVDSKVYNCIFSDKDKTFKDAGEYLDAVRIVTEQEDWNFGTPDQLDGIRKEGIQVIIDHFKLSFKAWSSSSIAGGSGSIVGIVMGDEDPLHSGHSIVPPATAACMRAFLIRPIRAS